METDKEKTDDSADHYGGIKMSLIDTCTAHLISAIVNGSVYKQYMHALEALRKVPGLKEQVDDLRRMNYRIQNADVDINLYDEMDVIDKRMEELCSIPEASQFLDAELALCRLLQDINTEIHLGVHLDIPNLS